MPRSVSSRAAAAAAVVCKWCKWALCASLRDETDGGGGVCLGGGKDTLTFLGFGFGFGILAGEGEDVGGRCESGENVNSEEETER